MIDILHVQVDINEGLCYGLQPAQAQRRRDGASAALVQLLLADMSLLPAGVVQKLAYQQLVLSDMTMMSLLVTLGIALNAASLSSATDQLPYRLQPTPR
jgi:hypothetical protein